MTRLALGAGLLLSAVLTGWLAGNTGEERVRAVTRVKTQERVVWQTRAVESAPVSEPAPVPVPPANGGGDPASAQGKQEDLPEAFDLVERMRRHLPRLADWQAEQIRRYHRGFREKLRRRALDVAAVLEAGRGAQFDAARRLQEVRRERDEFLRDVLGREDWQTWKEIETTGGRDVDEFLRWMQERNN